jgi:hypothetical protein
MQGHTKKQSRKRNPEDLIRENDFLKYKMRDQQKYIRKLEYDNALLQRKQQNSYARKNSNKNYRSNRD